ncbi:MAG: AAA family ATPase [Gordonia sp. (in: high G+C Gram-positive bacteria)]
MLRHLVGVVNIPKYPQIPPIFGRPGDGKSYQTKVVLKSAGCVPVITSASVLQGAYEGDAVAAFDKLYARAYEIRNTGRGAAIVIEDFDTSIASTRESTSYGVNSQLLVSHLMNLSEDVGQASGRYRAPIFLTGNDFSGVYAPLLRPGRMSFIRWSPTSDELKRMIENILSKYGVSNATLAGKLVSELDGLSIATVEAAVQESLADALLDALDDHRSIGINASRAVVETDISRITMAISQHYNTYLQVISDTDWS